MDARWMPLLAAAVGVLGAVGGALVGGFAANQGQEKGFERERAAEIQDLRIEAYGTFVGAAEEVSLGLQEGFPEAEKRAALRRLLIAEARVSLVADNRKVLERAALDASNALESWKKAQAGKKSEKQAKAAYGSAILHFLKVSRDEIEASRE